ncbi:Indole-3-glycerol phosphate synthase [Thermanaerovibrio velox DSM 12556]|uniref:Indole-3-glycerol phosphate synthase n=1 Tax=Thermanaerovibrio velox DSM 12556 TaxID=926567 RepID=H0UP94_9BACT|nr:indole-3-glycerol phosphate synthase TrpC [Thermanaerovibrio velox]EHM09507.1 Indole-3-glycerol phosphate synthase [Thermanaerovibrio velox DSM 12556]
MILDRIVLEKNHQVQKIKGPKLSLKARLATPGISIIGEIKKASPSKGILADPFEPDKQLEAYIKGGADGISIVTDQPFFQGSPDIMRQLRPKADIPFIRKDFIVDPVQVYESLFLGADAVLLIAAILPGKRLQRMLGTARSLGLEAVVEVHDQEDLRRALETETDIIGINNRDLRDFSVNLNTTYRIMEELRRLEPSSHRYVIAESGISCREDVVFLEKAGVHGILVGESLMVSKNPSTHIKRLKGLIE